VPLPLIRSGQSSPWSIAGDAARAIGRLVLVEERVVDGHTARALVAQHAGTFLRCPEPSIRRTARARLRIAAGDVLGWTPVSIAEIGAGIRPREAFVMSDLTRVLHCVELDERVGRKAGAYRLHFGGSHGVEIADALIAAAAHVHGCRSVLGSAPTHEQRHRFSRTRRRNCAESAQVSR
jgi:predicted nucleic acid-binding protein